MECKEYRIGQFLLQPYRQLLVGGAPLPVGRKALELLSVLAKAQGALVTKNELMTAAWPNTVVEDNALQVHIAALRKLLGTDADLLSTVHGYGYRLAAVPVAHSEVPQQAPKPEPPQPPIVPFRRPLRPFMLAAAAIFGVSGVALWLFQDSLPGRDEPHEARVAVLPFDTHDQKSPAPVFADGLQDEILNELSDNHIQAVSRTESVALRGPAAGPEIDRLGADLLLDGTVKCDGKTINVHLFLDDARERVSIWSGEFQGPADAIEALQVRVATQAADVVHWAKMGRSGKFNLDAASLAAFVAGRESTVGIRNGSRGAALTAYKNVSTLAPNFSWGHSGAAVTYAFMALEQPETPQSRDQLRVEARREAQRALELDPHNGEAYLALELAMPPLDWKGRETVLAQGTTMDQNFEPGFLMLGRLLTAVGRGRDALALLVRAHDEDPLHNGANWSLALSLAQNDRLTEARALVAQMRRRWPGQMSTREAQHWVSFVGGATDELLGQLADPAARSVSLDEQSAELWTIGLKAATSRDPDVRAAAIQKIKQAGDSGTLERGHALTLLAILGDLDGAFAQANFYQPLDPFSAPYLFITPTAPLRSDPRFMVLARKLNFVDYWRATGKWPDFCAEASLPYDCHIEANKIIHTAKYQSTKH